MFSYIRGNRENKLSEIGNSWSSAAGKAKIVIENLIPMHTCSADYG